VNGVPGPLLVVTDRQQAILPLPALAAEAVAGGARWLWLRDKDLARPERAHLAEALAQAIRPLGAALSIGRDIELAAYVGAEGVHLSDARLVPTARRQLGEKARVGVSAHSITDVVRAAEAGADYVSLSPIFATPSKPGYGPALGLAALEHAARLGIPVMALGGVTTGRVGACIGAGAAGVAVMGEIMRSASPQATVKEFLAALAAAGVALPRPSSCMSGRTSEGLSRSTIPSSDKE
jgi:thiamine-phosphate pyrophosphorylase